MDKNEARKINELQESYDELWIKREEFEENSEEYNLLTDKMYEIDENIHNIKEV